MRNLLIVRSVPAWLCFHIKIGNLEDILLRSTFAAKLIRRIIKIRTPSAEIVEGLLGFDGQLLRLGSC